MRNLSFLFIAVLLIGCSSAPLEQASQPTIVQTYIVYPSPTAKITDTPAPTDTLTPTLKPTKTFTPTPRDTATNAYTPTQTPDIRIYTGEIGNIQCQLSDMPTVIQYYPHMINTFIVPNEDISITSPENYIKETNRIIGSRVGFWNGYGTSALHPHSYPDQIICIVEIFGSVDGARKALDSRPMRWTWTPNKPYSLDELIGQKTLAFYEETIGTDPGGNVDIRHTYSIAFSYQNMVGEIWSLYEGSNSDIIYSIEVAKKLFFRFQSVELYTPNP